MKDNSSPEVGKRNVVYIPKLVYQHREICIDVGKGPDDITEGMNWVFDGNRWGRGKRWLVSLSSNGYGLSLKSMFINTNNKNNNNINPNTNILRGEWDVNVNQ